MAVRRALLFFLLGVLSGGRGWSFPARSSGPAQEEAHLGQSEDRFATAMREGQTAFNQNRLSQAARHFQEAARLRPDSPEAQFRLGIALAAAGQFQEAYTRLKTAENLSPSTADILLARAQVEASMQRFQAARQTISRARSLSSGDPRLDLLEVQIDLDEDKISQAFEKAERISNQYPGIAPIQGRLGSVFLGAGLFEEAAARLHRAHQLDSSEPAYALGLGEAWLQLGKYQETLDLLAALRPQMAASADLHRLLARAHLGRKDYPAAEREIKQVLGPADQNPGHALFLSDLVKVSVLGGDQRKAREYLRRLSDLNHPQKAIHLELGQFLFEEQEHDLAIAQFLRGEGEIHSAPEALLELAILESQGGAYAGALRHALEVLEEKEAGPYLKGAAATVAGASYLDTERRDNAIEYLELAVRLTPAVERNYLLLADIYQDGEQFAEAIAILERGRKAIPDSTGLLLPLGLNFGSSGDYERATGVLRELIARTPSQVEAYMPLAQAYESLGNVGEAIEVLQKRSELPPRDVMVPMAMAGFLFSKGEAFFDQVLAKLEEAEQIQASDPDIFYLRGRVYRAQERYEEAVQAFRRAVELDPLSQPAHYQLALAYRDAGKSELAFRRFEILQNLTAAADGPP